MLIYLRFQTKNLYTFLVVRSSYPWLRPTHPPWQGHRHASRVVCVLRVIDTRFQIPTKLQEKIYALRL